ncbi:cytochrome c-type biogenesis protein [Pelagimonas varians]|uniref:Cytochrome c-type biogenesis protein n=1 Tax=Pelagimonas varians TaxID=696760 RepID=A0A238JWG4_9RHOB|nr:cytochrome c-type biogenesis protein [Pelagimonas varians]PYG34407.1 cytochrome c-type biogenesis protein CcmH [Pelagimonas varians]SMX34162.1 Cytochrome c-type biogenesis protein CcmH precursor [Pelagimonas varians]
MKLLQSLILSLVLALGVSPALAVQPDEMLADPALEQRARDISAGLRCLVCQNESIDESNASLARDLRLLVRERIMAGDDNDEVVEYVVARYGEFVLLQPSTGGWNWLLWATGPLGLLFALIIAARYLRGRSATPAKPDAGLSDDEQARLDEILKS